MSSIHLSADGEGAIGVKYRQHSIQHQQSDASKSNRHHSLQGQLAFSVFVVKLYGFFLSTAYSATRHVLHTSHNC